MQLLNELHLMLKALFAMIIKQITHSLSEPGFPHIDVACQKQWQSGDQEDIVTV